MTTKYALKPGFTLNPDDLVIIDDRPHAPAPAKAPKTDPAQRTLDLTAKKRKPWEDAHPKVQVPISLRPSQRLHAKLKYLSEIMPKTSIQKLVIDAAEKEADRLLAIYDKD
jgi:hypothetical protein